MPYPTIKNKSAKCLIDAKNICPTNVFGVKDGKVFIDKSKECIGCKACEVHCNAIEVTE